MNWKKTVDQLNAKTFVLPEGWTSREDIAKELGCSADAVPKRLKPGLDSGEIESQAFKVFRSGKVVMVTAYRHKGAPAAKEWSEDEVAKAIALKKQGKSLRQIGEALGRSRGAVKKKLAA